ncbi:MAG: magnesium transporter CorA family protein [Paucimonas sp.]|nr:magnesium transporter CorA family protein [Paucimonas sp.]
MDIFHITQGQVSLLAAPPDGPPESGFYWLDVTHDEVRADPEAWRDQVERVTGTHVYDPHLTDAVNLRHPSYFDATQDYHMLVFRKLALNGSEGVPEPGPEKRLPPAMNKMATVPVTFLLLSCALVTVHAPDSRTIEAARSRLLETRGRNNRVRLPSSPQELMLRLLNAMVDQYLDMRQPLSNQIDRWQRALLNPRRQFSNWMSLLDARVELRRLEHLCEEQHDALQELRDHFVDNLPESTENGEGRAYDLLLVRTNDVMEHVTRVLNHTRRLEGSIETAVQIHFAAMAHRTSEIMRTLTVITALFMPLTLVTGIFGMNFVEMPLLHDKQGFWVSIGIMAIIVVVLLFMFRRKHYLDETPER